MKPILTAISVLLFAGCSDTPSSPSNPSPESLRLSVIAGGGQEGAAGERLTDSLVVRLTDERGAPVSGQTIGWVPLGGVGGEPFLPSTQTNNNGQSTNYWTLGGSAGEQWMEVRAILNGTPVVLDSIRAFAHAAAPVSLELIGDSHRGLGVGDSTRIALTGQDRFGNEAEASRLAAQATWSSSSPSVAVAEMDGTVRGLSVGQATIRAQLGSLVVEVVIVVNATPQVAIPVQGYIRGLGGESHGFAFGEGPQGEGRIWRIGDDQAAAHTTPFIGVNMAVTDSEVWLSGAGTFARSSDGAVWSEVPPPTFFSEMHLAAAGDELFGAHAYRPPNSGGKIVFEAFRHSSGAWENLDIDSAWGDSVVQVGSVAAIPGRGAFVTGIVQPTWGATTGRAFIAWWDGRDWHDMDIPKPADGHAKTEIFGAVSASTEIYAIMAGGHPSVGQEASYLLRVNENAASVVTVPSNNIVRVAAHRDGEPVVLTEHSLLWLVGGTWHEHVFTDGWAPTGNVWAGSDGDAWVSAIRTSGNTDEWAVLKVRLSQGHEVI